MNKYIDEKCCHCQSHFHKDDDIVVCPDCGTPHHRDCYFEIEKCCNHHLHEEGFEWKPEKKPEIQVQSIEDMAVKKENPSSNQTTAILEHLITNNRKKDVFVGTDEIEGIKLRDFAEFMGGASVYYLPVFMKFYRSGKKISFNLLVGILSPAHQLFRRMNLLGVIINIIAVIFIIPMRVTALLNPDSIFAAEGFLGLSFQQINMISNIGMVISLIISIGLIFFDDFIYYRFVVKKINEIKSQHTENTPEYYSQLAKAGRPSFKNMIVMYISSYLIPVMLISQLLMFYFSN